MRRAMQRGARETRRNVDGGVAIAPRKWRAAETQTQQLRRQFTLGLPPLCSLGAARACLMSARARARHVSSDIFARRSSSCDAWPAVPRLWPAARRFYAPARRLPWRHRSPALRANMQRPRPVLLGRASCAALRSGGCVARRGRASSARARRDALPGCHGVGGQASVWPKRRCSSSDLRTDTPTRGSMGPCAQSTLRPFCPHARARLRG